MEAHVIVELLSGTHPGALRGYSNDVIQNVVGNVLPGLARLKLVV
jgi:hypothetical protein